MKRAIFCAAVLIGVGAAWCGGLAAEKEIKPVASPNARVPQPAETTAVAAQAVHVLPGPLQRRYLELSAKKAQLLKEDELKKSIEALEAEVEGLGAWTKVDEAIKTLHEVTERHPGTPAASVARDAIQLIQERRQAEAGNDQQRYAAPFNSSGKPFPSPERRPMSTPAPEFYPKPKSVNPQLNPEGSSDGNESKS